MSMAVYFIRRADGQGPVKIGYSQNPERRLIDLQKGSAYPLRVLATVKGSQVRERMLHQRFVHLRLHGEWFTAGPELINCINHILLTGELPAWIQGDQKPNRRSGPQRRISKAASQQSFWSDVPIILKTQEVSNLLGVHLNTVKKWVNHGDLRSFKVGRVTRINKIDLMRFTGFEPKVAE